MLSVNRYKKCMPMESGVNRRHWTVIDVKRESPPHDWRTEGFDSFVYVRFLGLAKDP